MRSCHYLLLLECLLVLTPEKHVSVHTLSKACMGACAAVQLPSPVPFKHAHTSFLYEMAYNNKSHWHQQHLNRRFAAADPWL